MNQKQGLELLEQGKDAWNKWANKMLAEKDALVSACKSPGGDLSQSEGKYASWSKKAKADFSNYDFESDVDFRYFQFPGEVLFTSARFQGHVNFESAKFHGHVNFESAKFHGNAFFSESDYFRILRF